MPLPIVVEDINTVPEAFRAEYTAKDGKHHLNVEGLEDTSGLKSALGKERDTRAAAEKGLKAWQAIGKTPDEVQAMIAAETAAKEEALKKAGKFDEVLAGHKQNWAKETEATINSLTTERDEAIAGERTAILENTVTGALAAAKVTAAGLELLVDKLGDRIKIEKGADGKRTLNIMAADGTPMLGSGPGGMATVGDLVNEAVKKYPELFGGTGAGGGGTPPKQGEQRGKTMKRTEYDALTPFDQAATVRSGVKIVD